MSATKASRAVRRCFVREDADHAGATMLGVMNRSEDDNLDRAKTSLGKGKDGYLFKLIRGRVENGGARAESTNVRAPQDYSFRQLGELLRFTEEAKPVPRVRTGELPAGTHPGLLFALADLVRAGVEAARAPAKFGPQPRIAGIPAFVRYQPKWWFKVEGVLDETETL